MEKKEIETFYASSRRHWRQWLQKNHVKKQCIWLIMYKKDTGVPTLSWVQAVEEALCFGWIDSTRRPLDDEKFIQYYCKRKPKSNWSKINKDKVKLLIEQGLMTEAGLKSIQIAKKNGSWTALNDVEAQKIPADLDAKFKSVPGSKARFMSLSKSVRKAMLFRLMHAKRPETRMKRLDEIMVAVG
ncbi:YdeI family protein [Niastella sp. OAS944]|uniref:YdeI/OmpD-associated family protein n=1 Tax=Niastella sp. OAS944 TaxID=2664089 RepID=UPI0034834D97|nr:uncharacterized protein YdeI (YjbR/CyaY-like superfamily) [Chitinophagaceae bacterium OAS944]